MVESIMIAGLGGQGIVTLASLIAGLAEENGCRVSLFNAKGMAQRGGRVTAEIRSSPDQDAVFGPRIGPGEADIMIGMELGETAGSLEMLRPGGLLLLADVSWVPAGAKLEKLSYPDRAEVESLFSAKTKRIVTAPALKRAQNMFMLGLLVGRAGSPSRCFSAGKAEACIAGRLTAGRDAGLAAFRKGYEYDPPRV
jgi:indolepyruvate ferredoxin oxidoreductase beta subunit